MPEQRPRIAIVGAGPSGLAAAHHLADTHQVWLFDRRSTIGGVWAESSDQTYDWLETNTPTALFPFPGFPLTASDWQEELSSQPYVRGRVAQRYYARYARINRLDDQGGRLKGLKLGTTVLEVRRPLQSTMRDSSSRWLVSVQEVQTHKQYTLEFERLIIASGSFCTANLPASLQMAVKNGFALHSSSFGSPNFTYRLSKANKIVIVGAGKSAQDLLAHLMRSHTKPQSIVLVMPSHGRVSSWPLPHGLIPSYLSRMLLFGSRYLSPWATSHSSPTWLEASRFGSAIRRYYWSSLAQQVRATYPLLFSTPAPTIESWRDILRSTTRLFPAPSGLALKGQGTNNPSVLHATATDAMIDKKDSSVTLTLEQSDGNKQTILLDGNCDLLLACTGYAPPSQELATLFADVDEASKMGVPVHSGSKLDEEWHSLVEDAMSGLRANDPMLASLFEDEELFGQRIDTYQLYQHMVPIGQAHTSHQKPAQRDFAIMGLPQTISAAIVADVQARWLSSYFAAEEVQPLRLPNSKEAAIKETAQLVAASLSRYGLQDGRQGTAMPLELAWYADLLLQEVQSQHRRSRQPFHALSSDDFL